MLETYLDGNLVDEPIGLDEVSEHLYYSEKLSSYILEVDGNVTFTGDEYTYIRDVFNADVCGSIEIRILDPENQEIDFEGLINVADVQFNPVKRLAICEIQNNNITSRVDNNKQILCNLTAGKTKNDIEYSVTQQTITIYNPTGANSVSREGIRIFDALKSIITFISDGELGFVSEYFDYNLNSSPQVYSVLMTGSELRTGNGNNPTISFLDLFNDVNALENLAIGYDSSTNKIRIEEKDYFKQQTSSVTFEDVDDLSQFLATETLYARVSFGSAKSTNEFDYLQDIRFNGMKEEEYHLGGQCNTDTELTLSLSAIINDTNTIQDILPSGAMGGSGNDNYDDDVLILHCNSSNEVVLTQKPASTTEFYFNDRFTNRNLALRWLGQIPQSIYAFLGNGNDGCFINLSSDQNNPLPYTEGLQCDQETPLPYNDVNGNYAIDTRYFPGFPVPPSEINGVNLMTAGFYTAPANAVYSFEVNANVEWNISGFTPTFFFQRMATNTLDGAREVLDDSTMTSTYLGGNVWNVFGGGSLYLNAGEYVGCSYIATARPTKILAGSTFKVFDPLGGVWQTYDAADVYNIENQLKFPINVNEWKNIKSLPYQSFGITYNDGNTQGWLKDISRNLKTGESEITLIGQNG